eukprot:XP_011665409.1 PREDICTED: uncharacterized protein LOC105438815 [Strongylocentrotus purpuratus]
MDGFCLLYLLLILLMRSGDIETNPGPNPAVSTVSEMEFLKLARNIPPSHYEDVGISLGIPYAQLQAILSEKLKNYKNALMDVFMKWNVMQQPPHSNKRQLLAEKLREIDLGGLSDRLLNGPPISNSTGGPSRLLESQTKPPSAESETKSLSPELVERCAKDFKFKYRSTLCKIRADPLKPSSLVGFEKLHTSLVLEKEDGIGKQTLDYDNFLDLKVNREFTRLITVSEMEFLKLAQDIAPSYYEAVGISLGIPRAQLQAILSEQLKNYASAFMDVFMKWNVMQQPPHSNKRQLLADKLRKIDLGGLSDRLLNEPLIPNSQGGPSRLLESQTKPPSAGSQTKPLSPELVERCKMISSSSNRSTLCKIRLILKLFSWSIESFPQGIMVQGEQGLEKLHFVC